MYAANANILNGRRNLGFGRATVAVNSQSMLLEVQED
jgi:hypothetical protein